MMSTFGKVRENRKSFDMVPWDQMMCCPRCKKRYSLDKAPINLGCGHAVCSGCLRRNKKCPIDQTPLLCAVEEAPVNFAFLRMLDVVVGRQAPNVLNRVHIDRLDGLLARIGRHFVKTGSDRGASVTSTSMSRAVQRKALVLLRGDLVSGTLHCVRSVRSVADRILNEILMPLINIKGSDEIWGALRVKNCQFLGPAVHTVVLEKIHAIYSEGFEVSRKLAVLTTVKQLQRNYATITKTGVGHVFQILYIAHMFDVLPRVGDASLLRLKPEYDDFDVFRREHDVSLVRIIFESHIYASNDRLSMLFYGDVSKRSYIQSIIDRVLNVHNDNRKFLFSAAVLAEKTKQSKFALDRDMMKMIHLLEVLETIDYNTEPTWDAVVDAVKVLADLIDVYIVLKPDERERVR